MTNVSLVGILRVDKNFGSKLPKPQRRIKMPINLNRSTIQNQKHETDNYLLVLAANLRLRLTSLPLLYPLLLAIFAPFSAHHQVDSNANHHCPQ